MAADEDEERLLRSVALQNASSILQARQRAEQELIRAKEALELRTGELARSLAMMRATLESTTDGILVTDGSGQVTGFNEQFVEMWRVPRAVMASGRHQELLEVTGQQFQDPRRFLARIDHVYATSPPETYDLLELADGRTFERFSRIQYVEERNVGRVWSFRDVTERKRTEAALQQQSEWLRVTLASIGDAVITTDAEGRVTFLNGVAEALTGWSTAEAMGQPLPEIFRVVNEFTHRPVENPGIRALQDGTVVGLANHTVLIARDGTERPIDDCAAPMYNESRAMIGSVLVFRDVTQRHRAEAERERLLRELQEADRRKDEFLALLAHELRNPLAPIRNGLQVMRLAGGGTDAVVKAREMMDRQLGHMVRLVDDLLDVSRISRNKMELRRTGTLLSDVLETAIETARPLIDGAGHELIIALPTEPIILDADLTRLAQVFANLLTNSAKYTPGGGRIWLVAEQQATDVVVSIRDTGIGIPADSLPRIFDMFAQVDRSMERSTGGLGIGLALVKGLVEMHGGTVVATSTGPDLGSTFTVRLPIPVQDSPAASTPRIEDEHDDPATRLRVLVVDDNRDGAESMAEMLTLLGNDVHVAHDGVEAVESAAQLRPDLILMDVGMPRLNGLDATRRIREQPWSRGVTIIALTGWGQDGDRERSRAAGCDGHLVKPVGLSDLEQLLARLTRTATER